MSIAACIFATTLRAQVFRPLKDVVKKSNVHNHPTETMSPLVFNINQIHQRDQKNTSFSMKLKYVNPDISEKMPMMTLRKDIAYPMKMKRYMIEKK